MRITTLTILLSLALLARPAAGDGTPYQNEDKSITATLPEGWISKDGRLPGVSTFGPKSDQRDVAINEFLDVKSVEQPQPALTLQQLAPRLAGSVGKTIPGATTTEPEEAKVGGKIPAFKFTFSGTKDGDHIKGMKVFALVGSRIYIITYFSDEKQFDKALPAAQSIIDSMSITPPKK